MPTRTTILLVAGLLLGGSACADLDVQNPNAPDRERALAEPGDLESLISGSFNSWWFGQHLFTQRNPMSTVAFEHSAWPANFGMVFFSQLPREAPRNSTAWEFFGNMSHVWDQSYEAVASATQGLVALEDVELDETRDARARAFARFVQGIGHGSIALLYDRGQVFDETMDPENLDPPVPYDQLMEAALGYLDDAIEVAEAHDFQFPSGWMSRELTSDELVEYAYAFKAHFRTAVARTPEERAAVDWDAVLADIEASGGTDKTIAVTPGGDFDFVALTFMNAAVWSQHNYHYLGMADQSGGYQEWIAQDPSERTPFTVVTPDQRFPQGDDFAEQRQGHEENACTNEGLYWAAIGCRGSTLGAHHSQPGRGTWRWSNYRLARYDSWLAGEPRQHPEISETQLRLLRAEAYYRMGQEADAVELIDETRMTNGGLGTAAENADCVPRLPDGSCGDLFETLKWEWRAETSHQGFANYYLTARGWGDLHEGTFLHLPLPARDADLLGEPSLEFGGVGGEDAAPVGNYGF